jgi:hypothetical protein
VSEGVETLSLLDLGILGQKLGRDVSLQRDHRGAPAQEATQEDPPFRDRHGEAERRVRQDQARAGRGILQDESKGDLTAVGMSQDEAGHARPAALRPGQRAPEVVDQLVVPANDAPAAGAATVASKVECENICVDRL